MNQATAIKPASEADLWDVIALGLERDTDAAARAHMAAGRAIYFSERDTPAGLLVKKHPDGRRELVRYSREGDEVIRAL
jgi:hypothetical protein